MSFRKKPQILSSLQPNQPFARCFKGSPSLRIFNYISTVGGISEIEHFDGIVEFVDSNTLVYAL